MAKAVQKILNITCHQGMENPNRLRNRCTPVRMAKPQPWQCSVMTRAGSSGNCFTAEEKENGATLWNPASHFRTKLNVVLPCDPASALQGTHPTDCKTYIPHKNLPGNVSSSFINNCPTWEKPRCPSVSGWCAQSGVVFGGT